MEEFPEINSSHDTDYSQNITEDILSTVNESENESEETVFPEKTVEEKSDEITPMDSSENDNSLDEAHNIDKRDIENTEISNENTLANKSKETEEEVSNAVETFDSNEGELIDSEKEGTLYEESNELTLNSNDVVTKQLSLFERLKQAISEILEKEQSQIDLEAGDYLFTETLVIDGERDITLNANEAVSFKRSDGFKNPFFNIKSNSNLRLKSENNKIVFDGENKVVSATNDTGRFIHSEGGLYIDGAVFQNDRSNSGRFIAPIVGTGEDSYTEFNSGEIKNTDYRPGNNSYSSGGFYINDFAKLVMNGGIITGNKIGWFDTGYANRGINQMWTYSPGAGAVLVTDGANFTLNDGEISKNASYAGGVIVGENDIYKYDRQTSDPSELKTFDLATMEMNGGTINDNIGLGGPGGLLIFGAGKVTMNDGEISNNKGYGGGGVLAFDWYVDGSNRNLGGTVGRTEQTRAKVPYSIWQEKYPSEFIMNYGKINDNFSYTAGGGVRVSSSGVRLLGGEILSNKALNHGGGVYVNATPYVLRIENAYIVNNKADHAINGENWEINKPSSNGSRDTRSPTYSSDARSSRNSSSASCTNENGRSSKNL